jgi:hypothetical protein
MDVNQRRFLVWAWALMCLLCFTGCYGADSPAPFPPSVTPAPAPAAKAAFVYKVGQTATYCLSSETTKAVRFEGIRPDDKVLGAFDSAFTGRLSDVTWTQTVQAVDPNGQALLLIEIAGLSYQNYFKGDLVADYDSTRSQNTATALEDLIGLVYQIRVDVKGHVLQVLGADEALARLSKGKDQYNSAAHLISQKVIKARHTIKPLNAAPDQWGKNETWTSPESFVFGKLGGKVFEKTYVCQGVDKASSLVEITMADFKSVDKSRSSVNTPRLPFTSEDQFTGTLILDTRAGQIKLYRESLEVTWSFVDPTSKNGAQPRTGHMIARQAFLLERKESLQ